MKYESGRAKNIILFTLFQKFVKITALFRFRQNKKKILLKADL